MARKQPFGSKTHFRAPKHSDRTCPTGKVRFKDHAHAVAVLHASKNRRKVAEELNLETDRNECRTYPCKACKGFHLTSRADLTKAA